MKLLIALVAAEAVIIMILLGTRIQVNETPATAVRSPLELALEYEAPAEKFEQLVKKGPGWIHYRSQNGGGYSWPILASCAILKKTNYIRILIRYGANVQQAIESLKETGSDDAIQLLRQMESEVNQKEPG